MQRSNILKRTVTRINIDEVGREIKVKHSFKWRDVANLEEYPSKRDSAVVVFNDNTSIIVDEPFELLDEAWNEYYNEGYLINQD